VREQVLPEFAFCAAAIGVRNSCAASAVNRRSFFSVAVQSEQQPVQSPPPVVALRAASCGSSEWHSRFSGERDATDFCGQVLPAVSGCDVPRNTPAMSEQRKDDSQDRDGDRLGRHFQALRLFALLVIGLRNLYLIVEPVRRLRAIRLSPRLSFVFDVEAKPSLPLKGRRFTGASVRPQRVRVPSCLSTDLKFKRAVRCAGWNRCPTQSVITCCRQLGQVFRPSRCMTWTSNNLPPIFDNWPSINSSDFMQRLP
jgi:hypothetical protein